MPKRKPFDILEGDCLEVMRDLPDDSVDAVVTDPPYGLEFMGKDWDHGSPGVAFWSAVLRVSKPGAHLLAFGGTRTFHRLTCAIEDAGWEVRDCLMWLYGSGFPKSLNLGDGRGTALKPAWEPIVLARKPLVGTVAANVQRWGTGALNIDGCRIGTEGGGSACPGGDACKCQTNAIFGATKHPPRIEGPRGRWPANVLLDEESARQLDARSGYSESSPSQGESLGNLTYAGDGSGKSNWSHGTFYAGGGGASRFFYCAKASRAEREAGCDALPRKTAGEATDREDGSAGLDSPRAGAGRTSGARNHHPTVKPVSLMRYLVRLVTPPGGRVLDPFMGSGSTGAACAQEGFHFIGIDKCDEYVAIAKRRIDYHSAQAVMW